MGIDFIEVKKILVLGASEELLKTINERSNDVSLFSHQDEIYSLGRSLTNAKLLFIVESKCEINPLFIVRTIGSLFPHIKIVIIYTGTKLDFAQAQDLEKLKFNFLGEKTKTFRKSILNYVESFN